MSALPSDPWAGRLLLRPGRALPAAVASNRADWAARLAPGQLAAQLPQTLGCLYNLCGAAHRLCASLAVAAAQGRAGRSIHPDAIERGGVPADLRRETLREHLRRICLDWPSGLAASPPSALLNQSASRMLAACPLSRDPGAAAAADTLRWTERYLLGMPAAHWLLRWRGDPARWLTRWAAVAATPTAWLLGQAREVGSEPLATAAALRVHASDDDLLALAEDWQAHHDFSGAPLWHGQVAETGPWLRLADGPEAAVPDSAWLRLGARLAEVAEMVLAETAVGDCPPRLMCGSLEIGPTGCQGLRDVHSTGTKAGEGVAWVETARGLLVHRVSLVDRGETARVAACQVLAPTDWNFHPAGTVARRVAQMPTRPGARDLHSLRVLMAAYDPCVSYDIETTAIAMETHDA